MRVLVTGAAGQIGHEVVADLEQRAAGRVRGPALEIIAADRARLDVARRDDVLAAFVSHEPDVVIHPAAFTAVDACEGDPDRAFAVNTLGTRHVAEAARLVGAHVCYVSTDYVFDGESARPYREWDEPNPRSVYGRSKLGGERELDRSATIVRTAWVCGRTGQNFVKTVLRLVAEGRPLRFVDDQRGSPTVAHDLAPLLVDLGFARRPGLFHATNQGETTWFGLAEAVIRAAGADATALESIPTSALDPPRAAPRPANSVLDNAALRLEGIPLLPDWRESIDALVASLRR